MRKVVVIHQPDFLSYLGYFHRFLSADLYIALDTVQFVTNTSRSWQNRDKIKTPRGEAWLTVPVQKAPAQTVIKDVLLSENVDWRRKNLDLLSQNYRAAPFFKEIFPHVEELYAKPATRMMDFNLFSIDMLLNLFDIKIDIVLASSLDCQGKSNELLVALLKKVSATAYLSGTGARAYFDPAPYQAANIDVLWQNFQHPVYPQLHGPFIPNLSSIDLLFNCGTERAREMLRAC